MWTHRTKSYFPLGVSPSQMSSAPQKSAVDFSPGSSYKARSSPAGAVSELHLELSFEEMKNQLTLNLTCCLERCLLVVPVDCKE